MRRTAMILLGLGALAAIGGTAYAATGSRSGKVAKIKHHDTSYPGYTPGYSDWFTLEGVDSAGSCGTLGGLVPFLIADNESGRRMLALVTAAKLAGRSVTVGWDDGFKQGAYCKARFLELAE